MYFHECMANILMSKTLAQVEGALNNISELDREQVMAEVFKILRDIPRPKPYGDAVLYQKPRVSSKLRLRDGKYLLWINNRLVECKQLDEALYHFVLEKILHGPDALTTRAISGDPLSRKINFVRHINVGYHVPKEVKRCTIADDAI